LYTNSLGGSIDAVARHMNIAQIICYSIACANEQKYQTTTNFQA